MTKWQSMFKDFYSRMISISLVLTVVTLVMIFTRHFHTPISVSAFSFALIWCLAAIIALIATYRSPRVGFLLSVFSILTVIRILGINNLYAAVIPIILALFCLLVLFFFIAYKNVKHFDSSQQFSYGIPERISAPEWHLAFVRMYIGYDLIAHFGEKLFAGPESFLGDVKSFTGLGLTNPGFFVILAGLCELAGALSISLGFLTRLGAIGITLYMLIATVLGNHFNLGFIWARPGGGWEFPVLRGVLLVSFCVLGAGPYSIDAVLKNKFNLPSWLKKLMGFYSR